MDIPTPPPALKVISPYMKLAKDYDKREPVVAYYCECLVGLSHIFAFFDNIICIFIIKAGLVLGILP